MTDTDAIFETLAARRRRYVLYYLLEVDVVTTTDLAGLIAAAESGRPAGSIPSERRRRVTIELERTHLPLLDSRGFVDHDRERGLVELTAEFETAMPYLELASRYERPPTVPARSA